MHQSSGSGLPALETPGETEARETTQLVSGPDLSGPAQSSNKDSGIFVLAVCGLVLLGASCGGLWAIPALRIVEDVVCRAHYGPPSGPGHDIDEQLCKADEIQARVAYIFAVYTSIQAVIGASCTLPWCIAAEKIGRKPLLSLAAVGIALDLLWFAFVCAFPETMPLEAVWLAPVIDIVGGGNTVLTAVLFSMLSDAIAEEERTAAFMRASLSAMVGNLVAPAVAGSIMERAGPWTVTWLAIGGLFSFSIAVQVLRDPKPPPKMLQEPTAEREHTWSKGGITNALGHAFLRLQNSLAVLKSPSCVLLLVASLAAYPIILATMQFMPQFASRRYHISLAQTGYLMSFYGLATSLAILWILPAVARFVAAPARTPNPRERDLLLIRLSSMAWLTGSLVMFVAPSLVVFTFGLVIMALGTGWASHMRSLATLYVDAEHRTSLYSILSIVDAMGSMYAQPMLAALFTVGMRIGGIWIGLPYLGISSLITFALLLLLLVRLPKQEVVDDAFVSLL